MADCNGSIGVIPEGGVTEARGLVFARLKADKHCHGRVVGGACLDDTVVTGAVEVVLVVVEGEHVEVTVEMAVAACGRGQLARTLVYIHYSSFLTYPLLIFCILS